jgi:hypothetical protein
MVEIAKKDSWKTSPLPAERAALDIDATIDEDAWEKMKIGFVPQTANDKWFVYVDTAEQMHIHRASTGTCIFQVQFGLHPSGDGITITEAWANRNPEQYRNTKAGYDAKLLIYVIRRLLLKHDVPFPAPTALPKSNMSTHEQHVLGS